jgi:hypothetical protein
VRERIQGETVRPRERLGAGGPPSPVGILRAVEPDLVGLDPGRVGSLLDKVHRLSVIHAMLRLDLTTLTAAEERAVEAILSAPPDTSEPVRSRLIRRVLVALDSPGRRIVLARAVRDEGHIPSDLAAAVLQLTMEQSTLFSCCVLESLLAGHSCGHQRSSWDAPMPFSP